MPWSFRSFSFFSFFFKGKTGHGALVGITQVKGTSVDNIFYLFDISWKKSFLALVVLTVVKGTSVTKKRSKKEGCFPTLWNHFWSKSINNRFKNSSKKRSPKNMKFDANGIPKWSQNRSQKSSKINAKTGNEKNQESYPKTCFSEW